MNPTIPPASHAYNGQTLFKLFHGYQNELALTELPKWEEQAPWEQAAWERLASALSLARDRPHAYAVTEEYVLVPREATEKIREALFSDEGGDAGQIWERALTAALSTPTLKEPG
jgi:hypothetical protein